ncbi:MAG: hypothetical protein COB93_08080 [Sneathiella sp.]|nr:MAG: hypothetical protein COB93_08080 [Sneathiella sp.]
MNQRSPRYELLVEPDWLQARLDDSTVRIIDTSVDIIPQPPGPSDYVSRQRQYLESHIPGAAYLHMIDDLSDSGGPFPFALPAPETVWQRLADLGIRNTDTIVLYGNQVHWATHRCWWVLAVAGADVRLLNANFSQWVAEDRPLAAGPETFEPSLYSNVPKLNWVARKAKIAASLKEEKTILLNALSFEQYAGRGQGFGRPGRIPGSLSLPSATMMNLETGAFRPVNELAAIVTATGIEEADQLITYCGGGIAACTTFFALRLLGYDNLSLYDGSLLEWAADPDMPMIID